MGHRRIKNGWFPDDRPNATRDGRGGAATELHMAPIGAFAGRCYTVASDRRPPTKVVTAALMGDPSHAHYIRALTLARMSKP